MGNRASTRYTSLMENVDNVFMQPIVQNTEILPGYGDYRNARMTGDLVFDCRLAYTFNDKYKLSILANNLLNREYSNRPGNVLPPRTLLGSFRLILIQYFLYYFVDQFTFKTFGV